MDVVTEVVNEFTLLLKELGCDTTVLPKNNLALGVLWIQYSWAVFLVGIGVKSLTKLFAVFATGRGGKL